jgi:hypothetical protein
VRRVSHERPTQRVSCWAAFTCASLEGLRAYLRQTPREKRRCACAVGARFREYARGSLGGAPMTREEMGRLLKKAAKLGDWLQLVDFEASDLYILAVSDTTNVSLSFDAAEQLLRATFDITALPGNGEARNKAMEVLLNANALHRGGFLVSLGVSPLDDEVTLTATYSPKQGGERDLLAFLSGLVELVDAWRAFIRSIAEGAVEHTIPEMSRDNASVLIIRG